MAFGDPIPLAMGGAQVASALPVNMGPLAQAMNAPQLQNKPKLNWLGVLADALAGAAGRQGPYASMLMQQHQADQENAQYEHHQQSELEREKALYEYENAHPRAPGLSGYAQELVDMGLSPGSPEFSSRMNSHLNAVDDPVVTITLPGDRVFSGPRSQLGGALSGSLGTPPSRPVGNLTPIGGQTPSASGGFPRYHRPK